MWRRRTPSPYPFIRVWLIASIPSSDFIFFLVSRIPLLSPRFCDHKRNKVDFLQKGKDAFTFLLTFSYLESQVRNDSWKLEFKSLKVQSPHYLEVKLNPQFVLKWLYLCRMKRKCKKGGARVAVVERILAFLFVSLARVDGGRSWCRFPEIQWTWLPKTLIYGPDPVELESQLLFYMQESAGLSFYFPKFTTTIRILFWSVCFSIKIRELAPGCLRKKSRAPQWMLMRLSSIPSSLPKREMNGGSHQPRDSANWIQKEGDEVRLHTNPPQSEFIGPLSPKPIYVPENLKVRSDLRTRGKGGLGDWVHSSPNLNWSQYWNGVLVLSPPGEAAGSDNWRDLKCLRASEGSLLIMNF